MPRTARLWMDGFAYHVLNRGNRRQEVFAQPADYESFLRTRADALDRHPIRLLSFVVMPNHFHLVVWPEEACAISAFMRWFMNAHIRRHHMFNRLWGTGHLYQGRFKAFPIQRGDHLLTVHRYVEANALRANLVRRAQEWPYSSLVRDSCSDGRGLLSQGPVARPDDWSELVNQLQSRAVRDALRTCAQRQIGFGDPAWVTALEKQRKSGTLNLECPPSVGTGGGDTQD